MKEAVAYALGGAVVVAAVIYALNRNETVSRTVREAMDIAYRRLTGRHGPPYPILVQ